jgi:NitT/TauT family transport system substrate-binding protein
LKRAGFDPATDANIVQIGGVPALEAAFRSSRIDAFILSPPLPQKLESDGVGTILVHNTAGEVPELNGAMTTWLATPEAFAKANPDVVKGYDKAVAKAAKWLKDNPDEGAKELAVKWFADTSPENLKIALTALLPAMNETGAGSAQGLQKVMHVYDVIGQDVKADLTEGVLWTNAYH